jgi:hypothetical protein
LSNSTFKEKGDKQFGLCSVAEAFAHASCGEVRFFFIYGDLGLDTESGVLLNVEVPLSFFM